MRKAASQWATVVSATEPVPYVFAYDERCRFRDRDGEVVASIQYEQGDTLSPGFHLYVTSHPGLQRGTPGWATGACTPWAPPPVTKPRPNGFIYIVNRPMMQDWAIDYLALHEVGHAFGIGLSHRWGAGIETDSVQTADSAWHAFTVQTDSAAIGQYVDWISHSVETWTADGPRYKRPYPLRKLPVLLGHLDACTLSGKYWPGQGSYPRSVMATGPRYNNREMEVITRVDAALLDDGFVVDWDVFPPDDTATVDDPNDYDPWSPDESYWTSCPEVRLRSGIGADQDDDASPDFIFLGNDIWPFDGNDR